MTHSQGAEHEEAHIGRAAMLGLAFGQVEGPALRTLSLSAIQDLAKERLTRLLAMGALTAPQADMLRTRVDSPGTEATQSPLLGPDGQLDLAGVLSRQLPNDALQGVTAAGLYVAATSGLGAALIGMAVCSTPCAVIAAWNAGAIVATLEG
jgi:hypothetical protein